MLRSSVLLPSLALIVSGATCASAQGQTSLDGRVSRLESEIRAVQRKVFPDGAGKYLQPELTGQQPAAAAGSPATSPVADLEARVSAIESQVRTLTGQVEQTGYQLRQLQTAFDAFKAAQAPAAPPSLPPTAPGTTSPPSASPAKPMPKGTDAVRQAAVAAVERPAGDGAEDGYTYGYRLWAAKFFPEAQVQLKATVDKFPGASTASRAQNLLGRAYLDDGKPALASVAFYENYQKRPKGDRAADSLTYLGEALIQLKKLPDACKVYSELEDVYGATLRSDLRTMMEKGRARAKCGA